MKHALTYIDVRRVKRLSKQLKATARVLSDAQRSDKASVELRSAYFEHSSLS